MREYVYNGRGIKYLGMPAWNQGAARSSPSSALPVRLSTRAGGVGGGMDPPLLELICDILFALISGSVEHCDNLDRK